MSVLIKGMEMPKNCHSCPMCLMRFCQAGDRELSKQETRPNAKRPEDCPLVEIPPHGRLIDADAAVVAIQNSIEVVHDGMQKILLDYAQKMFNATPTIIESEASR